MKLGRLAAVVTVLGLCGSSALAGNGSNFWHYQNGLDYYFTYTAGGIPTPGSAVWRCFPGSINHSPTRVVDVNAPVAHQGQYGSKIETLWMNVICGGGFGGTPIIFPYVAVSSNTQSCAIVTSAGVNWGLFTGLPTGVGAFLLGPLNPIGTLELNAFFAPIIIPGNFPVGFINTVRLDVVGTATTPSAITVPEGAAVSLIVADSPVQGPGGSGTHQYWTGSVDDRRVCSVIGNSGAFDAGAFTVGQYYILTGGSPPKLPLEWGNAVSTIDAVVELGINAVGPGPSGLNPGVFYAAPYDAGQNGVISLTGSTLNAPTAGEIFGIQSYDDNNPFGGSNHLSLLNFSGIQTGYPAPIPMCPTAGGLMNVPTGGSSPGSFPPTAGAPPRLSAALPQQVRSTGKFDFVTNNLLANPFWTGSTVHGVAPFGIFFPFYPALVKCGGSTGNNGGAQILIPVIGALVGLEVALWQLNMNAAGTAIAINANNGHSHTNITPIGFAP